MAPWHIDYFKPNDWENQQKQEDHCELPAALFHGNRFENPYVRGASLYPEKMSILHSEDKWKPRRIQTNMPAAPSFLHLHHIPWHKILLHHCLPFIRPSIKYSGCLFGSTFPNEGFCIIYGLWLITLYILLLLICLYQFTFQTQPGTLRVSRKTFPPLRGHT